MELDSLSDVLRHVGVKGTIFCRAEVGAPWALSTRGADSAIFHVIVRGSGLVKVGSEQRAWRAGDVLLLPRGDPHVMSDGARTRAIPLAELASVPGTDGLPCVAHGGDGPRASILCGTFQFGPRAEELLLSRLPSLLHVDGSDGRASEFFDATLRLLSDEVSGARPGADTVVAALAEVLLVHALRGWMQTTEESGWLAGLRDPVVARALGAIHRDPASEWTAASLARTAGVSRSILYERFGEHLGESPASYLARWRIQVAQRGLEAGGSLSDVAASVGYRSEAAFSRAFKRHTGSAPSVWRREHAA